MGILQKMPSPSPVGPHVFLLAAGEGVLYN